jgi:hypothetical protein
LLISLDPRRGAEDTKVGRTPDAEELERRRLGVGQRPDGSICVMTVEEARLAIAERDRQEAAIAEAMTQSEQAFPDVEDLDDISDLDDPEESREPSPKLSPDNADG